MGDRLQSTLDDDMVKWLREHVANPESMSDAELIRHWLEYARRKYELENAEAGIDE